MSLWRTHEPLWLIQLRLFTVEELGIPKDIITNEVLAREDKVVLFLSTERRWECFFTSFAAAALKK